MKVVFQAILALVLGIMLLSWGKSAMANGDPGIGKGGVEDALPQCRVFSPEILDRLDLTQEQKEAIFILAPAESKHGESKVHEMMETILKYGSADEGLTAEAQEEAADRLMEEEERMADLYEILTPEQRERLETAITAQERGSNSGGRRSGVGGFGQGGPGQGGGPGQRRGQENPLAEKLTRELDLTSSQEKQVTGILEENMGRRHDPRQEEMKTRASRQKLFKAAWTEMPDLDRMRQTADDVAAENMERMTDSFKTMSRVRAILTGEQQDKLDTLMQDRQGEELFQPPMSQP